MNRAPVTLEVDLVWLDSTLEPIIDRIPPRPKRGSKRVVYIGLLLAIAAVGAWFVLRAGGRSAAEHLQAGWQAYQSKNYDQSAVALSAASAKAPDTPGVAELKIALAVAPTLDSIEADISAGRLAVAHTRAQSVLSRAPRDRRAVRLAIRLRTMQANAELAKANAFKAQPATTAAPASRGAPTTDAPRASPRSTPAPAAPRSAATTAAARPPTPAGRIRVTSEAPAIVFVDGVLRAYQTPTSLKVTLGKHAIELRRVADGKLLARRSIEVKSGRRMTVAFAKTDGAQAMVDQSDGSPDSGDPAGAKPSQ